MQSILTHIQLIDNNITAPSNFKEGVKSYIGVIVKYSHQQTDYDSICSDEFLLLINYVGMHEMQGFNRIKNQSVFSLGEPEDPN